MTQLVLMMDRTTLGKGELIGTRDSSNVFGRRSIQVGILGSGQIDATVRIYGCNDGRFLKPIMDIVVGGPGIGTDVADDDFPWEYYLAEVIAISGVAARVSVVAST